MRIFVTTAHQYPVGTALTNRIRSYLEQLALLGHDVQVLIYRPSECYGKVSNPNEGICNLVKFRSCSKSLIKHKNPFYARITWIYGYLNCLRVLYLANKEGHIDVVIQAHAKSSIIPILFCFTRIYNSKFILENSEYPWFILKRRNLLRAIDKLLYEKLYYKMFDGVLSMTETLAEYHRTHSKQTAKIFHLPMTVDMNRFDLNVTRENYVTYIGNVSYDKDGVGILVDAFINVSKNNLDWKLMIIGITSRDDEIKLKAEAAQIRDRVITMGDVHRDSVPRLLCMSKILALARPRSLQSEGGFPTKLGEYLATGNMVVVTRVGEIGHYLKDKVSAILSEPDSVKSFTDSLMYAMDNYDDLTSIRESGLKVCQTTFNSKVQAERLASFLQNMLLRK